MGLEVSAQLPVGWLPLAGLIVAWFGTSLSTSSRVSNIPRKLNTEKLIGFLERRTTTSLGRVAAEEPYTSALTGAGDPQQRR
ncbi:MAG: hypothetical protein DMG70_08765 [Acidobacteria bacterium]|nr:MAG: hypothetical protein DMG70_08765 [Acidobacteriota bacterium]PYY10300.1 MAG: hypothetical protein DMG69_07055 [Acidobacteriota bacterium]